MSGTTPRFILASASPSRALMLKDAGVSFDVHPAAVDEESVKHSMQAENASLRDIADALAELKALRVSSEREGLVLGADQVLLFEGELIDKVPQMSDARSLLKRLSGKQHQLISAAVIAEAGQVVWRKIDQARLFMRSFSDEFLDQYLAAEGEAILAGVGCYRIEGRGAQLFSRIDGSLFTVRGLPLLDVLDYLRVRHVLTS